MKDFKKSNSLGKRSFGAPRGPRPFGARDFDRPTERHQAVCNECHKTCEVPFRPNGKKPVYCRECFKDAERTPSSDSADRRDFGRRDAGMRSSSRPQHDHDSIADLKRQLDTVNAKLDKLMEAVETVLRG